MKRLGTSTSSYAIIGGMRTPASNAVKAANQAREAARQREEASRIYVDMGEKKTNG